MSIRVDDRTEEQRQQTWGFVVATDSFMSGWGRADGGRSLYAVAVPDETRADDVEWRMDHRDEFKRVRVCLPDWRPRLYDSDHLHIVWDTQFSYQPGPRN